MRLRIGVEFGEQMLARRVVELVAVEHGDIGDSARKSADLRAPVAEHHAAGAVAVDQRIDERCRGRRAFARRSGRAARAGPDRRRKCARARARAPGSSAGAVDQRRSERGQLHVAVAFGDERIEIRSSAPDRADAAARNGRCGRAAAASRSAAPGPARSPRAARPERTRRSRARASTPGDALRRRRRDPSRGERPVRRVSASSLSQSIAAITNCSSSNGLRAASATSIASQRSSSNSANGRLKRRSSSTNHWLRQTRRREHEHALRAAGRDLARQDHAGFDGLAETDFVREQRARRTSRARRCRRRAADAE